MGISHWLRVGVRLPYPCVKYNEIISWANVYDTADIASKKMIVNNLIKRIDVYRGCKLRIDFNIDFDRFNGGFDIEAITA